MVEFSDFRSSRLSDVEGRGGGGCWREKRGVGGGFALAPAFESRRSARPSALPTRDDTDLISRQLLFYLHCAASVFLRFLCLRFVVTTSDGVF